MVSVGRGVGVRVAVVVSVGRGVGVGVGVGVQESGEQGSVADHRFAQVLGRRLTPPAGLADPDCLPVVTDHLWVVNGDVVRLALKVVRGVAAFGHHRLNQVECRGDRRARVVHELSLRPIPGPGKLLSARRIQLKHLKTGSPVLTIEQVTLRFLLITPRLDSPVILLTEVALERLRSLPASQHETSGDSDDHHEGNHHEKDRLSSAHGTAPFLLRDSHTEAVPISPHPNPAGWSVAADTTNGFRSTQVCRHVLSTQVISAP